MKFGDTINASLGRTDYSAYTQGAAQGASQIGQGLAHLGQGIGAAIKDYNIKKEEKELNEAAKAELKKMAIASPELAAKFNITDVNDDKQYDAGVKVYGARGALQLAHGWNKDNEDKAKEDRVGKLAYGLQTNAPMDLSKFSASEFMKAQGMVQAAQANEAGINKVDAETAALGVAKVETPTQFGVAYAAFKKKFPNPTPEQTEEFMGLYQQGNQPPTPYESTENKERAQAMSRIFQGDIAKGDSARVMLNNYSKVKGLLDGGVETGMLQETKLKAMSFIKGLGIDVNEAQIANAETAKALMGSSLIEWFDRTKGSISNSENSLFQSFGPEFAKTEKGNKLLIEAAEERLKVDTDLARISSNGYEKGMNDAEIMKARNARIAEYDKKLEAIEGKAPAKLSTASGGVTVFARGADGKLTKQPN